jgi:signal transduction histidine kinase
MPSRLARFVRHRWAKRTVRLRLTALYSGLLVAAEAGLLTITYILVARWPVGGPIPGGLHGVINFTIVPNQRVIDAKPGAPVQVLLGQVRANELHELLIRSGIALAIMAVVSICLGWWISGRVLRPLRTITARTRSMSAADLHQRLALTGPRDELTELADTIDGLLNRLEDAFEAQRSFVANASHELRTPLAMMRTSIDVAEGKPRPLSTDATVLAGKVREGLDQADRLVESFLVLARAQHGSHDQERTVALPVLVARALADRMLTVAQRGLAVTTDLEPADVTGGETLLARMVANVVDNAIRHGQRDGSVHIATDSDGTVARLVVDSSGPILDEQRVRELGQPFRRLGTQRTGDSVGLGLSIVAATVAAHDGALHITPRDSGGLRVVVSLPAAVDRELVLA